MPETSRHRERSICNSSLSYERGAFRFASRCRFIQVNVPSIRTEAVLGNSIWRMMRRLRHTRMQPLKLMFEQKPVDRAVDQSGTKLALYSVAAGARTIAQACQGEC
jgi:hypothetical protein